MTTELSIFLLFSPFGQIKKPPGDGIVPLASTELSGADCEIGVYSGHGAHTTDEAIAVVQSLLKLHSGAITEAEVTETIKAMDLPFARFGGKNLILPASSAVDAFCFGDFCWVSDFRSCSFSFRVHGHRSGLGPRPFGLPSS